MDPISFSVELELGTMLVAIVGALATWIHHGHSKANRAQRERHYQQARSTHERHHQEHMQVLRGEEAAEQKVAARSVR